ncbi:gliding motility-associated C-terminal domain-containing protein [Lishizhenia tianjinensis]|uniref:Gliding motility-associated C-terminal domain-containing protein n=1 Tax=Lishizhenia tianjinensis TaxID=477690 RepID=A0A1I7BCN2_9FLAO|nr:gliding motility-associated C-terminal domain-containing protein [Lishizhenia tianjinensis]SFT84842.1 gliding motility-associated C-terminal domain-containing protein [Lishizhenia tianjinensis]
MKRISSILFILGWMGFAHAQPTYDLCNQALEICANTPLTVNNIGATSCASCADDAPSCFTTQNSVWVKFTSDNNGGDASINFSNFSFQTGAAFQAVLFEASNGCDPNGLTEVSTCEANITTNFTLNAFALAANQEYFLLINGNAGAEGSLDLLLSGTAVQPDPVDLLISYENSIICFGEEVSINASITGCDTSAVNWYINGNFIETNTQGFFTTSALQDGDVVTADIVCFAPCNQTFTSNALPFTVNGFNVYAGVDRTIELGEDTQLNASTNAPTFTWFPTIGMKYPDLIQPFVSPKQTTTYTLTVTDGNCTSSDEVVVTVDSPLDIKNTFTPNGDGKNDTWEILGIEKYADCRVEIFNRWGQVVFKKTGYNKEEEWNGTHNGQNLPAGVYYYVIYLTQDKDETPLKGHINLIR